VLVAGCSGESDPADASPTASATPPSAAPAPLDVPFTDCGEAC
jgi:hypothetical protein